MTVPDTEFLAAQVRYALSRGLPEQVAEDLVFAAWEKAAARHEPGRGALEPLMRTVVKNDCAGWWREHHRQERLHAGLRLVEPDVYAPEAEARQTRLLEALDPAERAVFAAWATQRHLGKGQVSAAAVGAALGLGPREFENAKRRLKTRIHGLLETFGWTVADVLYGDRDVERTG